MIRVFRYRLYPSRAQSDSLDFLLEQARLLYNTALKQRVEAHRCGEYLSYGEQRIWFRRFRRAMPDTLGRLSASAVQRVLRRLDLNFRAYLRQVRCRPRLRHVNRSIEFPHGNGCRLRDGGKKLYVRSVGEIKVKYHRVLRGRLKRVVLKRKLGKWYASLYAEQPDSPVFCAEEAIGVDVGLCNLLAFSDGTRVANPKWFGSDRSLAAAQRRVWRRKKGSRRWAKASLVLAKRHNQVSNRRFDFWHKVSRWLADRYSLVAIEDLNLTFMLHKPFLSSAARDAGFGIFRHLLSYKLPAAGGRLVLVDPRGTSQKCSKCGRVVPKNLRVRVHRCSCGLTIDRDVNAARNILARAEPSGANAKSAARCLRSRHFPESPRQ